MPYLGGTLALKIGSARRNQKAACLRAAANSLHCDAGLNGMIAANDSSVSNISAAIRRYFSAFRRPSVATRASTWTLKRTSSAVGGGKSSGNFENSGISTFHSPKRVGGLNGDGVRKLHSTQSEIRDVSPHLDMFDDLAYAGTSHRTSPDSPSFSMGADASRSPITTFERTAITCGWHRLQGVDHGNEPSGALGARRWRSQSNHDHQRECEAA